MVMSVMVEDQGHMVLCVFCLHDTRVQYLALSEGFTCFFSCFACLTHAHSHMCTRQATCWINL